MRFPGQEAQEILSERDELKAAERLGQAGRRVSVEMFVWEY